MALQVILILLGLIVGMIFNWIEKPVNMKVTTVIFIALPLVALILILTVVQGGASSSQAGSGGASSSAISHEQVPPISEAASSTPLSSSMNTTPQPSSRYLSDMQELRDDAQLGPQSINGHSYPHSISAFLTAACTGEVKSESLEYQIDKQWHTFQATLFASSGSISGITLGYTTYAEGAPVGHHKVNLNQELPISIDVTGVSRIKLEVVVATGGEEKCQAGYGVWGDAQLVK